MIGKLQGEAKEINPANKATKIKIRKEPSKRSKPSSETTNPVTPTTYQWQVKVGAGAWINLSEVAPYSGTQTQT